MGTFVPSPNRPKKLPDAPALNESVAVMSAQPLNEALFSAWVAAESSLSLVMLVLALAFAERPRAPSRSMKTSAVTSLSKALTPSWSYREDGGVRKRMGGGRKRDVRWV